MIASREPSRNRSGSRSTGDAPRSDKSGHRRHSSPRTESDKCPHMAEAVKELTSGRRSRNKRIERCRFANGCFKKRFVLESSLRHGPPKIVLQQPQPAGDIETKPRLPPNDYLEFNFRFGSSYLSSSLQTAICPACRPENGLDPEPPSCDVVRKNTRRARSRLGVWFARLRRAQEL